MVIGCQPTPSASPTTVDADKVAAPKSLAVTDLIADKVGAQPSKTTINFTATASGGLTPLQYKWFVAPDTKGTWKVFRDWSTNNSFSWTPTDKGTYMIGVWARSADNTADASENGALKIVNFTITP
jgi:hypothetical protein